MRFLIWYAVFLSVLSSLLTCTMQFDNPSDTLSSKFTTNSHAELTVMTRPPYYQNDTILFNGDISSESVRNTDLVKHYGWDLGNDGSIDFSMEKPGIIRVLVKKSGQYSIGLQLSDAAGYISRDVATIQITPKFNVDILFPNVEIPFIDTSCAFYSQNQYTMRPVVLLGRYMTYRNKMVSISTGNFIFELLKNITGTVDYSTLSLPYKTGFSNGVYTLDNGNITMKAAFLYGKTANGHIENDTVKYDCFDPRSYIQSVSVTTVSPYYSYTPGPLWDLASDFSVDVSNPLKPVIKMNISLKDLKFCGFREVSGRYTMTIEVMDSIQFEKPVIDYILFNYHGLARIEPFFIRDINTLVNTDSLSIDMSGSEIVSDSFPMTFSVNDSTDISEASFNFKIQQNIIQQKVRFGISGGNRKVLGSYSAQSALSVQDFSMVKSYFCGVYSTANADTAFFYCNREMTDRFGTLFFDTPQSGFLTFDSDRYSYQFTIREGNFYEH